jgi:copper chaperone CopZ
MEYTYTITGMHCGACVTKISAALAAVDIAAQVTLTPPQMVINAPSAPDMSQLQAVLHTAGAYQLSVSPPARGWLKTYYPLLLIITLISLVSCRGAADIHDWMLHFMAGFFIVFGFFKLLDLRGFRDAYATYDLLARKWRGYGYVYPFLELALGFAFLFQVMVQAALIASIILMAFGSLGVIQALRSRQQIRCACLGTALNLPMSTITLVEDLGMAVMALGMLVYL